jgi:hypothetical protein
MIGAGPVDERLDSDFQAAFGLSTGRNYGSTETGALFAGLADLPPLCVGLPMPGVDFRVLDAGTPCADGQRGELEVRLADSEEWRPTGDIAVRDEHGRVTILGRRFGAIRKGGRWIAPLEVESVLREHPHVRDAHVRAVRGRFTDEDSLVADVAVTNGLDEAELRTFASARLSDYKVPERINVLSSLLRDAVGKASYRQQHYRLAEPPVLLEAIRAYRRSELLLAMADLGLVDDLLAGADLDELAVRHGLPIEQLHWLLTVGTGLGLLSTEDGPTPGQSVFANVLDLESMLSRSWVSRAAIAAAVGTRRPERPFETAELEPELVTAYQRAMHGEHTAKRTRLGRLMLGDQVRGRLLEVSAGPGRYIEAGLAAGALGEDSHLLRLGRLAGDPSSAVLDAAKRGTVTIGDEIPAGPFDAVVVANGIHGPGRGADLDWLLGRLAPGGVLLVDDIFLPDNGGPGTEIGLDWLTHGGISWPRLADLTAGVTAAGGTVGRTVRLTPPECCLILVTEEQ